MKTLLVLLPIVLCGCMSDPDKATEIRYMAWGNPQQLALEESLCREFEQANPGIRVKFLRVPGSAYGNKMIVMLASRTAPDVMRVDHYNFPALVRKDYFHSLDDLIAKDPDFKLSDFLPAAIEEGRYHGKLYGLNVLFGSILVYYNKNLVKQAGLEDPYQLWEQGKWTWDRFKKHAIAMTAKDTNGKITSFGTAYPANPIPLVTAWAYGGEIMNRDWSRTLLGSGPAVDGWRFWYDLRYVHGAAPTPAQGANSAYSFESGKLGMHIDWMGMTPRFREVATSFDWDVVPIPSGPASGAGFLKGNQLCMSAESRHPEEAWKFMKFITSEKVERKLGIELRRAYPTRLSVSQSKDYLAADKPPYNMRAFLHAVKVGRALPITDRWPEWTGAFFSGMDNLIAGRTQDVAAATKDAEDRANAALSVKEGL
jgi:multiple sugar transport system substrate-binding protein